MKIQTLSVVAALTASIAANPSQAQSESRLVRNLDSGKKQVVVAYGTSLTQGGAWVAQLAGALNEKYPGLATVVNSGGSGRWSDWGVKNVDAMVVQKKPDAVFIEFAINDSVARFNCTVDRARTNLVTMITAIQKGNPDCEIVLMTMTPGDKHPEGHASHRRNINAYYDMYRAVAKERGFILIDHYPTWKALQAKDNTRFTQYVPDSIHVSAAGCSEVITPAILKALGISPPR